MLYRYLVMGMKRSAKMAVAGNTARPPGKINQKSTTVGRVGLYWRARSTVLGESLLDGDGRTRVFVRICRGKPPFAPKLDVSIVRGTVERMEHARSIRARWLSAPSTVKLSRIVLLMVLEEKTKSWKKGSHEVKSLQGAALAKFMALILGQGLL